MIVVISQMIIPLGTRKIFIIPFNLSTVGLEGVIFIPTSLSERFIGPIKNFPVGFSVTGGKFRI